MTAPDNLTRNNILPTRTIFTVSDQRTRRRSQVAKAVDCKSIIRGFDSHRRLFDFRLWIIRVNARKPNVLLGFFRFWARAFLVYFLAALARTPNCCSITKLADHLGGLRAEAQAASKYFTKLGDLGSQ